MNERMSTHLTEETMLRWQAGDANEPERLHVAACAECQARTKPLSDALSWFGAAARQWGEEKAVAAREWEESKAAAGREWRNAKTAATQKWRTLAVSWAAACVVLLLIFGIAQPRWQAHRATIDAQARQQERQQAQQNLASDNALLEEVDQDVSQEVPDAMQPLSLTNSESSTRSTGKSTSGATMRQ